MAKTKKTIPAKSRTLWGVVAVGVVFGGAYLYHYAKDTWDKFKYSISGFGIPSYVNKLVVVPVRVKFKNPSAITINPDHITAELFIKKPSGFEQLAKVDQAVVIPPGESLQVINISIDPLVLGNKLLDTASNIISSGSLTVRTDVRAVYFGIRLPKQSFENQISLSLKDLLKLTA
jgi:hypothetical protein